MKWKHYAVFALCMLLTLWRIDHLQGKLTREQDAHGETRKDLQTAIAKGNGWKALYEQAVNDGEGLAKLAQACLAREAQAVQARQERQAILQTVKPRPRTEQEQTEVADDETRKSVASRLNRPL